MCKRKCNGVLQATVEQLRRELAEKDEAFMRHVAESQQRLQEAEDFILLRHTLEQEKEQLKTLLHLERQSHEKNLGYIIWQCAIVQFSATLYALALEA
jgi:hypothetical protein